MCLCACVGCPRRPGEAVRSPGEGVTGGCEATTVCLGIKLQSLERPGSPGLLTPRTVYPAFYHYFIKTSHCERHECLVGIYFNNCHQAALSNWLKQQESPPLELEKELVGAGETNQQLKTLGALSEDQARFSAPTLCLISNPSSRRSDTLLWPLWGPGTHVVHNRADKIIMHIK